MEDPARALCRRLVTETLDRIREDRRRASVRVAELLAVIEERLLDPDFDVSVLLRECGLRDKNASTRFANELTFTPKVYILDARMELAGRMLISSELQAWRIGAQVGYLDPSAFGRAFKRWCGQTPGDFRKSARAPAAEPAPAPGELVSRQEIRQAVAGDLDPEHAEALAGRLYSLGDMVCAGYRQLSPPADGGLQVESTMARHLWQWIEHLPYEVQMQAVERQAPRYQTLVLFNRLCTVSIEAEDGVRALKLATLAMASLHAMGERVGEDYLNAFARVYAVMGYAQRRAGDLEACDRDLNQAKRLLAMAGDDAHPVIVAEVCLYEATLEAERDNIEEAGRLSELGTRIIELTVDQVLDRLPEAGLDAGSG